MDYSFLSEYAVPIVVGICLCVRYILKKMIPSDKAGRYIPLIMAVLGVGPERVAQYGFYSRHSDGRYVFGACKHWPV